MAAVSFARPRAGAWFRLGRVSNLPTVWTNVLAVAALVGANWSPVTLAVIVAMTLMYVGGMFLNDAFDHRIDKVERPSRPIPSGVLPVRSVLIAGFALLALAMLLIASTALPATVLASLLVLLIVAYDLHHKNNQFAPLLMGVCRALVYLTAAVAVAVAAGAPVAAHSGMSGAVLVAAIAMLGHVAGLTYAARAEAFDRVERLWPLLLLAAPFGVSVTLVGSDTGLLMATVAAGAALLASDALAVHWLRRRATSPGAVSRAVSLLIAAISLVDGLLASAAAGWTAVTVGLAGFGLTLTLQRIVPGT